MSSLSLVIGADGFMGTHMVEVLAEAGHQIRVTADRGQHDLHAEVKGVEYLFLCSGEIEQNLLELLKKSPSFKKLIVWSALATLMATVAFALL